MNVHAEIRIHCDAAERAIRQLRNIAEIAVEEGLQYEKDCIRALGERNEARNELKKMKKTIAVRSTCKCLIRRNNIPKTFIKKPLIQPEASDTSDSL